MSKVVADPVQYARDSYASWAKRDHTVVHQIPKSEEDFLMGAYVGLMLAKFVENREDAMRQFNDLFNNWGEHQCRGHH